MKKIMRLMVSGIAARKIRFVLTIILFAISLSLFGAGMNSVTTDLVDNIFKAYPKDQSIGFSHATLRTNKGNSQYIDDGFSLLRASEIQKQFPAHRIDRVYKSNLNGEVSDNKFFQFMPVESLLGNGFVVADELFLTATNYTLFGELPKDASEVIITEYMLRCFREKTFPKEGYNTTLSAADVIGKTLDFNQLIAPHNKLKIVGVLDTKIDFDRYLPVWDNSVHDLEEWDEIHRLEFELRNELNNNYHSMFFVSQLLIDANISDKRINTVASIYNGEVYIGAEQVGYGAVSETEFNTTGSRIFKFYEDRPLKADEMLVAASWLYNTFGVDEANLKDPNYLETFLANRRVQAMLNSCLVTLQNKTQKMCKIVGVWFDRDEGAQIAVRHPQNIVLSDVAFAEFEKSKTEYPISSLLTFLTGERKSDVPLIQFGLFEGDGEKQTINGCMTPTIYTVLNIYKFLKPLGSIVGALFLVFSMLMMTNFVAATIAAKHKEIGVMRAMGSTQNLIFGIYFLEALVTAFVSFMLSIGGTAAIFSVINTAVIDVVFVPLMSFVQFNIWGIVVMLSAAVLVAAVGCILPLSKLGRKKPMEIIRS